MGSAAAAFVAGTKVRVAVGGTRESYCRAGTALVQDARRAHSRADTDCRNSSHRAGAGRITHRLVALSSDAISGGRGAALLHHSETPQLAAPCFGAHVRGVSVS